MTMIIASAAGFLVFAALGALLGKFLNMEGTWFYVFSFLMGALGLTFSALFTYFWEKKQAKKEGKADAGGAAPGAGEGGDAARWIREANARLAKSKAGVGIENLPMIFVIGDRGTAKTSTLLNSGLEAELLTGQIYQDDKVAPTRGANVFYGRDSVFVEAGGSLMANPGAWKLLVAKLRPGRLKSLVGGGGQAPRGVLLCFDLEAFSRRGAADAIGSAARYLHDRLGDISEVLGISFPVYVLFTRADRIPFFADFVRNLTNEEAGQVVGVTLPMRSAAGGVYAEAETQRLTAGFNDLCASFCDQRLRLLPRENDVQAIPGAYEFAREFRKLRTMLVQFLVDIGRPSQLRASPFLRGFYFSGVRPVQVQDLPANPLAQPAAPAQTDSVGGGATRMFRAGFQAEQRAQAAQAPQVAGGRKVPQWLFLGHLFHDVILADGSARAASGSSVKTSMTKRILLATAAALCLVYSGLLLMSYLYNDSLQSTAQKAADGIGRAPLASGAIPDKDALVRLDTLRQSLQELIGYQEDGRPLHMGWGLYRGEDMIKPLRQVYYAKFKQLLFGETQGKWLTFLQTAPATPPAKDVFGDGYDILKSYLLTTSESDRSKDKDLQSFLGSHLLSRWSSGREEEITKERMDLAKLQFDFYAQDLHHDNPYTKATNEKAVAQGRLYLSKFSGADWKYQSLLAEAAKSKGSTNFNKEFMSSREAVTSLVDVDFAFTREGWVFVQNRIKNNINGEPWVMGADLPQGGDQEAMAKEILDKYTTDYVKRWRAVLKGSAVNGYQGYPDAAKKLSLMTNASSPLLALFWWISYNTGPEVPGVDGKLAPEISNKFKAVHMVVSPSKERTYRVPANSGYVMGLQDLQMAVDAVANTGAPAMPAMQMSAVNATKSRIALTNNFPDDPDAHIQQVAEDLLQAPIKNLDRVGVEGLRSGGVGFCNEISRLAAKFPFKNVKDEMSLAELAALLKPGTGRLWTFYEGPVKEFVKCQDGNCSTTNQTINPLFVTYLSRMMQFSKALYASPDAEIKYNYTVVPQNFETVESYIFDVNGAQSQLKSGEKKALVWPGTPGFRFSLRKRGASDPEVIGSFDGVWAAFHFFEFAETTNTTANGVVFGWKIRSGLDRQVSKTPQGKEFAYDILVDSNGGPPFFSKDYLSTLVRCATPLR